MSTKNNKTKSNRSKSLFAKKEGPSEWEIERRRRIAENWDPDFESPEQYVGCKLVMLRKEMYIEPTEQEVAHLYELKTVTAIDNAVHSIIARHWADF